MRRRIATRSDPRNPPSYGGSYSAPQPLFPPFPPVKIPFLASPVPPMPVPGLVRVAFAGERWSVVGLARCVLVLLFLFARELVATEIIVPGPAGPRIYEVEPGEWQVRDASGRRFVTASDRRAALSMVASEAVVRSVLDRKSTRLNSSHG